MKEENLKKNRNETLKKKSKSKTEENKPISQHRKKKETKRFCSLVKSQTSRVLVPEELAGLTCDCSDTIWRTVRRSCDRPAGSRAPRASPPPAWCSLVPLGVAAAAAPCIGRIYCGLCADAGTHTCMDTHTRARVHMHILVLTFTQHVHTHIFAYTQHVYTHIRMHTACIYTPIRMHAHTHMQACTYTCAESLIL